MTALETRLWVTGPESKRWFDAVHVMWNFDCQAEMLPSIHQVPLRKRSFRSQHSPKAEVILWAGDQNGIHELIQSLGSPLAHSGHRLYIAAGQWSDAERSVLQRFGVRLIVAELTDLIAIRRVVRDWPQHVSH